MELISTKVCKTSDIGINENLFGGVMLSWLDESGFLLATDKANSKNMVTLKVEEVLFKLPVKVNDHIRIYGEVVHVGNSSIRITLEARRRDFHINENSNKETIVCTTSYTFVQIDKNGHSLKFTENQLNSFK